MRTISLHNIRYELRRNGNEVWLCGDGREDLIVRISRGADGREWEIRLVGGMVATFEGEETARAVFAAVLEGLQGPVTNLT